MKICITFFLFIYFDFENMHHVIYQARRTFPHLLITWEQILRGRTGEDILSGNSNSNNPLPSGVILQWILLQLSIDEYLRWLRYIKPCVKLIFVLSNQSCLCWSQYGRVQSWSISLYLSYNHRPSLSAKPRRSLSTNF